MPQNTAQPEKSLQFYDIYFGLAFWKLSLRCPNDG